MKHVAWIAVAALATLIAAPAFADSRQTTEDPGQVQSDGSQTDNGQSGATQQNGGTAGDTSKGTSTDGSGGSQAAAPPAPTMKELLAGGYEVKSVVLVPRDVVKRGGADDAVDAVMIMMQNGAALATCYEEYSSFVSDPTTLTCNVFK